MDSEGRILSGPGLRIGGLYDEAGSDIIQVRLSSLIERMAAIVVSKCPCRLLRNIITARASGLGAFMAAGRLSRDVYVSTYSPMSLLRTYERVDSSEIRDMRVDKVDEA
jgi:hypothetical protein